jgi:voltage-gated potassium channel
MKRMKGNVLIGFLSLADLTLLIGTTTQPPTGIVNIFTYLFDIIVVGLIAYSFIRRMKESPNRRRYIVSNWYEILGMMPIVLFVLVGLSSNYYDGFVAVGVMLRLLAIIYLIKLSRSIGNKSKILGGNAVLQIFIIFYLTLTISAFFFYISERPNEDSQITSMGDALWWTIQTATTSTFGPNAVTTEGRIVGTIVMLVGIGITGAFISTLAVGLTRSRAKDKPTVGEDPKAILKIRLAKGELTKEAYLDLLGLISQ